MAKKVDFWEIVGSVFVSKYGEKYEILDYIFDNGVHYYKYKFIKTGNIYLDNRDKVFLRKTVKDEVQELANKKLKKKDFLIKRSKSAKQHTVMDMVTIDVNDKDKLTILWLDQASKISGVSVIKNGQLHYYGKFQETGLDTQMRIHKMKMTFQEIMKLSKPDYVVLEDIFLGMNVTTFKILAMNLGVMINLCIENEIPYVLIPKSVWANGSNIYGNRAKQKYESIKKASKKVNTDNLSDDEADWIMMGVYFYENILIDKNDSNNWD